MGFDQAAYNKQHYANHAEQRRQASRDYYAARKDDPAFHERRAMQRELRHFGVPRSVIFRRTDGKCYFCQKAADVVHHLDDDGRTNERMGKEPGHNPNRLVPACRACHMEIHRAVMMKTKKLRAHGFWSRTYPCCIECGRTDRKHNGHGLCTTCAARTKRQQAKGGGV